MLFWCEEIMAKMAVFAYLASADSY